MSEQADSKLIARMEDVSLAFGENVVLTCYSTGQIAGIATAPAR